MAGRKSICTFFMTNCDEISIHPVSAYFVLPSIKFDILGKFGKSLFDPSRQSRRFVSRAGFTLLLRL